MDVQNTVHKDVQPSFRSCAAILNSSGRIMQGIENGGFLASFLVQDGIGMTLPRTSAGLLRDKDVTGHYNIQEGLEVFGREGLSGPCMMAVAPLGLFLAAKFGRSTSINSRLIKHFGDSLKEFISKSSFNKELLRQPKEFKQAFYRANIESMLQKTAGKENTNSKSVNYILEQIKNYEKIPPDAKLEFFRGKAKYRQQRIENIVNHINNIKYSTSSNLDMLGKVKLGENSKVFDTKSVIDAMIKYSDDAIIANKCLDKLDALQCEKIKNQSLGKRLITNISLIFGTLGALSVLPKIYARSKTAPGARKNLEQRKDNSINNNETDNNMAFKGKPNFLERLGKAVGKNKSDFIASELEYNGHNFTNTLMTGLALFGLVPPRVIHAYQRAEVDDNGKKDLTELWEILIRDISSSLAVVFAVPMGTRACVSSYEKNSGFVLMQKDRTNKSRLTAALDLLNPYSKAHVLTNTEIKALYDNINSKAKMLNFCEYIDKNGGDLQKIISKSDCAGTVFNRSTMELDTLKNMPKAEKNKKIISFFKDFNSPKSDEMITNLMKGQGLIKKNKIVSFARGLNSMPGLLTTFIISPCILGWIIPRFTYLNTRRIHKHQDLEKARLIDAQNTEKSKIGS